MRTDMKQIYRILGLMVFLFTLSCNLDRDLNNPNELSVDQADPNLLMNQVQLELSDFFARVTDNDGSTPASGATATVGVAQLARMHALIGGSIYDRAIVPQNMDEIWTKAYQGILVNIETLIPIAEEKQFYVHVGVAKIIKAYVYMTLVDVFGDVPYKDALKGTDLNFNPTTDGGATIYAAMLSLLDEAKEDLDATANKPASGLTRDIYYSGSAAKWITLANSLKLKAYLNMDDKAGIEGLINGTDVDLIDTDAEEFTYKYGTANVPIRSRHPYYRQYYRPQLGAAAGYINNYYMKRMYDGLGVQDPRWRYYFFRQVGSIARALLVDGESVPCVLNPTPSHYLKAGSPYCTFDPGFYGRDHGDNDGGPPDSNVITTTGVYPAGGKADTNNGDANFWAPTQQGQGGNGAGIEPIYMSWFTDFMIAEAVQRLGATSSKSAKEWMISGMNKSVNRVRSFAASLGQSLPAGLEPSQTAYQIALEGKFDEPTADKADIIYMEYYKSLWGNGLEAYNLLRRTGSPKDIQPMRAVAGGVFFRSLVYPAVFVNLNNSTAQKTKNDQRVFWDNGPIVN